jgi:hypothetical protein
MCYEPNRTCSSGGVLFSAVYWPSGSLVRQFPLIAD